ncbi:MAG: winged helix-turn-helix domain-containing protein [Proteobacteria bacterium]|nr:winged helix-turn-helix domain-containing protein [Pseudomonadota bacterium]
MQTTEDTATIILNATLILGVAYFLFMRDTVLQVLLDSEEPMYLAEISKKVDETSQLVQYHLQRLVEDGILLTYIEDRKRFYALQPVQYKYPPSELYNLIMPLVEDMAKYIECEQTYETPSRILANNLILLLERLTEDIDNVFDDVNGSDEDT